MASSTPPTPSAFTLPEGSLILDRPAATAPVQAWVKVTRHALCSRAPHPSVAAEIEVSAVSLTNGRLVFGFLVTPASFELAFSDHDLEEPTAGDADCIAFVDKRPIRCYPPAMSEPVGILVAASSIISPSTTSNKRFEYRSRADRVAQDLDSLHEPENRVAAITAQPCAYVDVVHTAPSSLSPVVDDHALLRVYSGQPSTTHDSDCSFMRRFRHDYPDDLSDD